MSDARSPARGGLLELVTRRPVGVSMVVMAIVVFGTVSLQRLPVSLLPDVSYPTLTVRTEYDGAAPADVEKLITERLEREISVVSDLVGYRSISRAGVSDIILEFGWDTEMTFAAQDVREKVDQVVPQLPDGIERPLVLRYDPTLDPVIRLALYPQIAGEVGLLELRRRAEDQVRRALENGLEGVAAVRVRGGFEEEWRVELDEARLEQLGITAATVSERIGLENANVAGGILVDGDREALVRTIGEIRTPDELEDLTVTYRDGLPVRVRDLGTVVVGAKERDVITRVEGAESVEIEIFKEAGANLVEVAAAVKTRLFGPNWRKDLAGGELKPESEREKKRKKKDSDGEDRRGRRGRDEEDRPVRVFEEESVTVAEELAANGLRLRMLADQSVFIENSINEVRNSALIGGLLAVLVLLAFLRRLVPTVIIGIAIPVSIVATFAPLFLTGVSLNVMSLGGLALGVGMLVDSSIVVLEAITRRREAGHDARSSAIGGTREVGLAVLASTLTSIAVFLPIVFVEGIAGEFFRDQSLAVVFSLVAALLAALFFIPMLASRESVGHAGLPRTFDFRRQLHPANALSGLAASRVMLTDGPALRRPLGLVRLILEAALHLPFEIALRLLGTVVFVLAFAGLRAAGAVGFVLGKALIPFRIAFDVTWAAIERAFLGLLRGALSAGALVLLLAAGVTWWAVDRTGSLGVELVPEVHQGAFEITVELDVGTRVDATDELARTATRVVRDCLEAEGIALVGLSSSAGIARDVIAQDGEGPQTLKLNVTLAREGDLAALEDRAIAVIRQRLAEVPGLDDPLFERPALFSTRAALEVLVVGPDLDRTRRTADHLLAELQTEGALTDVSSTNRTGYPELVVIPRRDQLTFHDLDAQTVARTVRDKVLGAPATRISRGDRKIDVLVRTTREQVGDDRDVLDLNVGKEGGPRVPLRSVARVERKPGPAEIRRDGGERTVVLTATPANLDLAGAAARIEAAVDRLRAARPELFDQVVIRFGGQRAESERSLRSLGLAMLIAIFLVYIVMASQFESLLHPFVILFSVPLAAVGAVAALSWLEIKLSIVVLIGAILLVGIVVNNAIVLVDAVNRRRRSGMDRDPALMDAARARLRPIMMTTATTVLGLLPLALGLGEGSEIRRPMAVTVIAGLLSSTLLTIVVVPVVYRFLSGKGPLQAVATESES